MERTSLLLTVALIIGFVASSPVLPLSPSKIVSGFLSNALSLLMNPLWSIKVPTRGAVSPRSKLKFESGYSVETVFDGNKLGIEPHSLVVLSTGELLILDSINSNIHQISSALSLYSRPKLVAGSAEGYSGHVDGRLWDSRMNHPKGLAVDDSGNIYVADVMNAAIRKISDAGVTTIAGGRSHKNGPSRDAVLSNDFDVVYVGSSCSLLVIDRGNRAIREIQLNSDDCVYQYRGRVSLGIVVLLAAVFFGYMLSLVQLRIRATMSSQKGEKEPSERREQYTSPTLPDQVQNKQDGFLASLGNLTTGAFSSLSEIVAGLLPGFMKRSAPRHDLLRRQDHQHHHQQYSSWPAQDSYVIPNEDEPPPPAAENRLPTPQKTYPFMAEDAVRKSRAMYRGWDHHHNNVSGWAAAEEPKKVNGDKFYDTVWTEGAVDRAAASGRHTARSRVGYSTRHL